MRATSQARITLPAAPSGMSPASAWAAASAASTSSTASTHARAVVIAATGPTAVRKRNGSDDEEDGLISITFVVGAQPDVEAPGPLVLESGEQPAGSIAGRRQHRIGVVRRLALEVDARHD